MRDTWRAHSKLIGVAVLLAISLIVVIPRGGAPIRWSPDAFFYQAQVYELQGQPQTAALDRAFRGPAAVRSGVAAQHTLAWVHYSARDYRRRWLVPALAAAITPVAGSRSLLFVSLLGYLLLGPALFALLRVRFSPGVSMVAAALCLLLPPMRTFAGHPLTDSWGVTMTVVSLIAGWWAIERGGRQILWWALAMVAVSLTRDTVLIPIVAVAAVAAASRSRRSLWVLITGIAATIPAFVLFGTPLIREMAYNLNNYEPVAHPSTGYVLSRFLPGLWSVVDRDLHYPTGLGDLSVLWTLVGLALVLAVLFMIGRARRRDAFLILQTGGLLGAALTIAIAVNYTRMRLELVFIPGVAAALAFSLSELTPSRCRAWYRDHLGGIVSRVARDQA